ncbi:MAG: hypothetical protein KDK37_12320 [Leptospiraceae bacterium]|nr:hypothetical protein [Leptospiraceae bacterium]
MDMNGRRSLQSAILIGFILFAQSGQAQDDPSVAVYQGQFTQTTLGNILLKGNTDYRPSYILTGAYNTPSSFTFLGLPTEWEGQVVKHSGTDKHLEFNAVFMARLGDSLDFSGIPMSIAVGEGLSLATRNPGVENPRSFYGVNGESEYSRNLLNYLVFELEVGLPMDAYQPRAFVRLHHRSGIYGTFCPPTCGSNYIAYGVKFSPFD